MDTLLYIGKANNLNERVRQHFDSTKSFISRQPNKSCRYANVSLDKLTVVEETLIIMHKPCFNSARLIQVSHETKTKPVYIQNHGDRGMLNIENTNFYFLHPEIL
jgi:excinuclease UvrABC nuclease subunit